MHDIVLFECALDCCFNEFLKLCDVLESFGGKARDRKLFVQAVLLQFSRRTDLLEIDELMSKDSECEDE